MSESDFTDEQVKQALTNAIDGQGLRDVPRLKVWPKIPEGGLVTPALIAEQESLQKVAARQKRRTAWLNAVPKRYTRWLLSDYSESVLRERAAAFLAGEAWSLYLHGGMGSRKTSFAVAVGTAWTDTHTGRHIFLPAYEAAAELRDMEHSREKLTKWQNAELLIIDDIGANRNTPHVVEQLLFLIQERYDWELATIITSNLDLDQLSAHLAQPGQVADMRASSRLRTGIVLNLGDKDFRLDAAIAKAKQA